MNPRLFLAGLAVAAPLFQTVAAPAPMLTYFGMISDEFGWPYTGTVNITLRTGGFDVINKNLTPARGVPYNYIIRVPYDTGVVEYASSSVTLGDEVEILVTDLATGTSLIDKKITVTQPPGTVVNLNAGLGGDTLADGLPDALRHWIWQSLGLPGPFDPTKITASMDSDGDGYTNLEEYLAGTDPANPADSLTLTVIRTRAPAGAPCPNVCELRWFSVPGKKYVVQARADLAGADAWTTASFAASPSAAASSHAFIGTGEVASVFIPSCSTTTLFRILAEPPPIGATIVP